MNDEIDKNKLVSERQDELIEKYKEIKKILVDVTAIEAYGILEVLRDDIQHKVKMMNMHFTIEDIFGGVEK